MLNYESCNYINVDAVLNDLVAHDSNGYYKFVRIKGEYRFAEVLCSHDSLAIGEVAETAAFVKIETKNGKRIGRLSGHSLSLKIGYDAMDIILLPELLEFELDWDIS